MHCTENKSQLTASLDVNSYKQVEPTNQNHYQSNLYERIGNAIGQKMQ